MIDSFKDMRGATGTGAGPCAAGFTIVEVVVASALMILVISGLLLSFLMARRNAISASNYEAAIQLARNKLERISTNSYANIVPSGPVSITNEPLRNQIQSGWIQVVVTTNNGMKEVQVIVSWTNIGAGGASSQSLTTALSGR